MKEKTSLSLRVSNKLLNQYWEIKSKTKPSRKQTRLSKLVISSYWVAIIGCLFLPQLTSSVFAANLFDQIAESSSSLYTMILKITTPLMVAVVAIGQLIYMTGNQKYAETGKEWRNRAFMGWVIINGMGLIVNTFTELLPEGSKWTK